MKILPSKLTPFGVSKALAEAQKPKKATKHKTASSLTI